MFLPIVAAVAFIANPVDQTYESIRLDAQGRPMIGVEVNNRGPFDMLIDTAAQTSVLSTPLVNELGLKQMNEQVTVQGAAGGMTARVYAVSRLKNALFDLHNVGILALPRINGTNLRGIVGMDIFDQHKIVFDLQARRFLVEASSHAGTDTAVIKGSNTDNRVTVPIVIDGVTVNAIIDTGAAGSVANPALLRALGWRDDDPRLKAGGIASGAGAAVTTVRRGTVGKIVLGPVKFGNVPLTFLSSNLPGDSGDAPTIILGMDLLGLLPRFAVDLPRAELQVYVPPKLPPAKT